MTLEQLPARRGGPSRERRAGRFRRRGLLLWAILLLPAPSIAALLAARQRVGDVEERFVREANALFDRRNVRAVHVDRPSPGAFGDGIAPHLASIDEAARSLGGVERIREVVSGEAPLAALPPRALAALARLEPDLDAALAATRAERADFPEAWTFGGDGGWGRRLQVAATITGLRVRLAVAAGDPARALRDGLDGLALGRDASIARGLVGRMVGAAIINRLAPPVAAALDALPGAAAHRDAARRLRRIRDALPRFSRTLADEAVLSQLMLGEALPASTRAALDPRARAMAERDGMRDTAWWQRFLIRDGWRDLRAAQDALVAGADLPAPERRRVKQAVDARLVRLANPFAAIGLPDYGRYAGRAEASVRQLDALVLVAAAGAFRELHGRWPGSVAELASAGELAGDETARLGDVKLELVGKNDALNVSVLLPRADESAPAEMRFLLRGAAAEGSAPPASQAEKLRPGGDSTPQGAGR